MRKLIGGLLGLCLLATWAPDASARTSPRHVRSSVHASAPARVVASRHVAVRSSTRTIRSTRSSVSPVRAMRPGVSVPRNRAVVTRSAAAVARAREAVVVRRGRGGRLLVTYRDLSGRMVVATTPYGRVYPYSPSGRSLHRTAMASCTFRNGRRICASSSGDLMGRWSGGLAPAALSQLACPDGTMATMAVGHHNITRCVPL